MWIPDLEMFSGPRYIAIADALSLDIGRGTLTPGDRLPPQRELAWALKVNFGTVTRAYELAAERGLVRGEIGRGTFVRNNPPSRRTPWPKEDRETDRIDMRSDFPCNLARDPAFKKGFRQLPTHPDFSGMFQYQPGTARQDDLDAAATWTSRLGMPARPEEVIITNGALHAGFLALMAVTRPGDTVLTETLTSPAIRSIAAMLHLRLTPVVSDGCGIDPDDLAAKLEAGPAAALYLVPDFQNPTAAILPPDRRRRVADIIDRTGICLVEDDVFGGLSRDLDIPSPHTGPISALVPERSFYVTSFSKIIAPGLRIGYLVAPETLREKALTGLRISSWMASPPMAALVSGWIRDGNAERLLSLQAAELENRTRIAAAVLAAHRPGTHPRCPHVWLPLSRPTREQTVVEELSCRGIDVTPGEYFGVRPGSHPAGLRLCLGQIDDLGTLYHACRAIAETIPPVI
ncbi:MAG TPA: PLP-dependent aminotransferase family protein [Desulfobacteraceae bacterium]|nr:PLP-dependent aminotransferase family protein [Desulfobacteraceae bacterium]